MFIPINMVSRSYCPCLQVEEHGIAVCCPCHMMEECLRKLMKFFGAIKDEFGHFSGRVIKNQNMAVPTSQLRDLAVQNTAAHRSTDFDLRWLKATYILCRFCNELVEVGRIPGQLASGWSRTGSKIVSEVKNAALESAFCLSSTCMHGLMAGWTCKHVNMHIYIYIYMCVCVQYR